MTQTTNKKSNLVRMFIYFCSSFLIFPSPQQQKISNTSDLWSQCVISCSTSTIVSGVLIQHEQAKGLIPKNSKYIPIIIWYSFQSINRNESQLYMRIPIHPRHFTIPIHCSLQIHPNKHSKKHQKNIQQPNSSQ